MSKPQKSQFKEALALATIMSGDSAEMGDVPSQLTKGELADVIQYVPSDRLEAFFSNSNVADGIHKKLQLSSEDKAKIDELETQKAQLEEQISTASQAVKEFKDGELKDVKHTKTRRKIIAGLSLDPKYVSLKKKEEEAKQNLPQLQNVKAEIAELETGSTSLNEALTRQISDNPNLGAALLKVLAFQPIPMLVELTSWSATGWSIGCG